MPVIVIGADAATGREIIRSLLDREGEVRAFVTDPAAVGELREHGVKVALGDVSDGSHVGGAAMGCFSAVLVAAAAGDGRERAFAATPDEVFSAWAEGLADAGVARVIWVGRDDPPRSVTSLAVEVASVDASRPDLAAEVRRIDDAA